MSNKLSYAEIKFVFNKALDGVFNDEAKIVHGWTKEEFLDCFRVESMCDMDEELSFAVPTSMEMH